jgi:hypothetical protein
LTAVAEHEHYFTSLYAHFGRFKRQDIHYHRCIEGEPGDCDIILIGEGRECDGRYVTHKQAPMEEAGVEHQA